MLYQSKNPHGGDIYGHEVKLDFSANTNPFGTPQGIIDAVTAALPDMHRYPDPYCRKLIRAISAHEQVPAEYLLCGNGAADLIYAYCEALRPKRALELAPTFSEYSLGLKKVGCEVLRHPLTLDQNFCLGEDFLKKLEETRPDVIFLCNPNNPTGNCIAPDLLQQILDFCRESRTVAPAADGDFRPAAASCGTRLFLDECFLDLTEGEASLKTELAAHPELFILKAFTKSYGMAGIRLGYGMSSDAALLSKMAESVQPWNVSSLAQAAGIAALKEGAFLETTKALIGTERAWLKAQLESLGFWVSDSKANYLLFKADAALKDALDEKQISIRDCSNYHGLDKGWYRIAVKLPEENKTLIAAIREICGKE